jgi:hypothetical protein
MNSKESSSYTRENPEVCYNLDCLDGIYFRTIIEKRQTT